MQFDCPVQTREGCPLACAQRQRSEVAVLKAFNIPNEPIRGPTEESERPHCPEPAHGAWTS